MAQAVIGAVIDDDVTQKRVRVSSNDCAGHVLILGASPREIQQGIQHLRVADLLLQLDDLGLQLGDFGLKVGVLLAKAGNISGRSDEVVKSHVTAG